MRLISWNVNGIRALAKKGFLEWLNQASPDILGIQELRAEPEQMDEKLRNPAGYYAYWYPASSKKGYSGVGLLSKTEPLNVQFGMGMPEYDIEGRVLIAEYPQFTLLTAYFPSGTRGTERVEYKLEFNDAFLTVTENLRKAGKPVIFCGDVNTAHKEIDLTYPKANEKTSGFMPVERAWIDKIVGLGYIDTFRHFYPDKPEQYSWWSARSNTREKNIGWRLDYFFITAELLPFLRDAHIFPEVTGSDHCPVGIDLQFV